MDMLLGLDMLKRHQVSHSSMYSPLNPFSTDCANTACYNWCESATAVHCHKLTIQAASLAHCGGCPSGQPRSLRWLSKRPASLTVVAVQAAGLPHCGGCPSGQPPSLRWLSQPRSLRWLSKRPASLTAVAVQVASLPHCGGCPSGQPHCGGYLRGQPHSLRWLSKRAASLTAMAIQEASLTQVAYKYDYRSRR